MSTGVKIAIGVFALFVVMGIAIVGWVFGINNTCVEHEAGIEAQYKDNQNNLSNYTKKIMEMAQVPAMARDDLKETIQAAIQGRYGKDGSKAVFQFIKEQNPSVDPGLYRTLQQAMSAGRDSFQAAQTQILDKCRVYETYYKRVPTNMIAGMFGFPKLDMKATCTPVTDARTDKAFETKQEEALKLR